MKKTKDSLTLLCRTEPSEVSSGKLALLIPAGFLLAGLWGSAGSALRFSGIGCWVLSMLICLCMLLCPSGIHLSLVIPGICCILSFVFHFPLSESLALFLNRVSRWFLNATGYYFRTFHSEGTMIPILLLGSVLLGWAVSLLVRTTKRGWYLLALPPLLLMLPKFAENIWFTAAYIAGLLLLLIRGSSGFRKPLFLSMGILALTGAMVMGLSALISPFSGNTYLTRSVHRILYEHSKNPLPEGQFSELSDYEPTHAPALEVTMAHWAPLYIRGFSGTVYSEHGWEPMDPHQTGTCGDALYALQSGGFFPAEQIHCAGHSLKESPENTVRIENAGACRAYTYVPYGIGNGISLNCSDLLGEGLLHPPVQKTEASLWPIEYSYLLQEKLKKQDDSPYLQQEAVYQKWVYETCLQLPDSLRQQIASCLGSVPQNMTTTQAKKDIVQFLQTYMPYREHLSGKSQDLAADLLQSASGGYCVHFATLATLMMRYCGIPARYVEGYLITPSLADVMEDGQTLTVQQTASHAWCEYYLDGIGWLPFDATPGYDKILSYSLPDTGIPSGDTAGTVIPPAPEKPGDSPLPVDKEKEPEGLSQWIGLRQALCLLGILLFLLLLALGIRTWILRRKLRKRISCFSGSDCRKASAQILIYSQELLRQISPVTADPLSPEWEIQTSAFLQRDLKEISDLSREIWFSAHAITETQQKICQQWLGDVQAILKQKTPRVKYWLMRWIYCRVI